MFYSFLRYIIAGLIWLINGHAQTQNKQQLPEGPWLRRTVRGSIPFF